MSDLPAIPDASQGGFVIDSYLLAGASLDSDVSGKLHGNWGFDSFEGPAFHLRNAHPATWSVAPDDQGALIVGRVDTLHLHSECAVCVDDVTVQANQNKIFKATWKAVKTDELEIEVPLKDETSGSVKLVVKQFGVAASDQLVLPTYAEAAQLDRFKINAGDQQGVLTGTRLDEVDSFELKGIRFVPTKLTRAGKRDELLLAVASSLPPACCSSDRRKADCTCRSEGLGRVLTVCKRRLKSRVQKSH